MVRYILSYLDPRRRRPYRDHNGERRVLVLRRFWRTRKLLRGLRRALGDG